MAGGGYQGGIGDRQVGFVAFGVNVEEGPVHHLVANVGALAVEEEGHLVLEEGGNRQALVPVLHAVGLTVLDVGDFWDAPLRPGAQQLLKGGQRHVDEDGVLVEPERGSPPGGELRIGRPAPQGRGTGSRRGGNGDQSAHEPIAGDNRRRLRADHLEDVAERRGRQTDASGPRQTGGTSSAIPWPRDGLHDPDERPPCCQRLGAPLVEELRDDEGFRKQAGTEKRGDHQAVEEPPLVRRERGGSEPIDFLGDAIREQGPRRGEGGIGNGSGRGGRGDQTGQHRLGLLRSRDAVFCSP